MNLTLDVVNKGSTSIVSLEGEVDAYTAPELKETLLPLMRKNGLEVEVNLEKVSYMDSTGLGIFISALKASKEYNSKLRLVKLNDRVYRLFEITGLNKVINIDSTVRGGF
ncbi:STAS domain-containing protein [Aquibacillus sp. 3ASR75-11]|uniref:Anti-sigma factor antagonist n=1 Tax=Terrihalobacillus insolitus TaxID=2950438 RepID=A0A9X3WV71_9BACI|nr:STAS domain-containing protein [Terrihalobacillus insolitus]MDC3415235.1 STAS domain-containing protein [Terrihalobacillus insolitus]MDC3426275.1 STAS domain-containing protein [Terrihalobacillus insolitus]